jgi:protein-tyrosine-phosphatase
VNAALRFDPEREEERARLAAWLAADRVAALPTDTVPGLATRLAPGGAAQAAERLARLKSAPADKPSALHLPDRASCARLAPALPPGLPDWLQSHVPGPWTILLPAGWLPAVDALGWRWPQVGLRVPRSRDFRACALAAGAPLMMSSINTHGEEPLIGAPLAAWLEQRGVPAAFDPLRVSAAAPSRIVSFDPLPRLVRGEAPASELRPGLRVLIVCSGNVCRSPLAVAILRQELAAAWGVRERDLAALGWVIESAGSFAMPGATASENSQEAAREIGLNLSAHRARSIEQALAGASWDLVLGMGRNHLASLASLGVKAETFELERQEVADPFGGDLATYRRTRAQLQRAAQGRVESWSRWPSETPAETGGRR